MTRPGDNRAGAAPAGPLRGHRQPAVHPGRAAPGVFVSAGT